MLVLIIRDGWGYGKKAKDNAQAVQALPTESMLEKEYPKCLLDASGEAIGLPQGQIGTSEIGHMTIGAGRVVLTDLVRINKDIKTGAFFKNKALSETLKHAKEGGDLHLMGLMSPGGVHSDQEHAVAIVAAAAKAGIKKVLVHAFLDGRDVPPRSAKGFLKDFEKKTGKLKIECRIATVMGRYYAMDRDERWERTKKAYDALVSGAGKREPGIYKAIDESYAKGVVDEFVEPIVTGAGSIKKGDTVIFFNFRGDRARQVTRAFHEKDFREFDRGEFIDPYYAGMARYDDAFDIHVLYPAEKLTNTLGEVIANDKIRQLRVAETEKFAHVTFFFNGISDVVFPGEERILVPSPKVATYDLKPEMSAYEITEKLLEQVRKEKFGFCVINYANGDMVGHTGKFEETKAAVKVVDECVGRILAEVKSQGGTAVITADHGNCEDMWDEKERQPKTAHTLSKVRLFVYSEDPKVKKAKLKDGGLANIAPTILKLMKLSQPKEMTEKPLL